MAELVSGAVVGAVFGELLSAFLEARGKVTMFKQTFNYLQSTLLAIKPIIQEMEQQNDYLGRPKEELDWLIKEMEKGSKLVLKCSEINRINIVAKVRYQNQLEEFIDSLVKYFTINMQTYLSRDQKESLLKVDRILSRVDRILSGVNKLFPVNPVKDTAGSSSDSIHVSESEIHDLTTPQEADRVNKISSVNPDDTTEVADAVIVIQPEENAAGTSSANQAMRPPKKIQHESTTTKAENNQMDKRSYQQSARKRLFGIGQFDFPPERLVFVECPDSFDINDLLIASVELIWEGSYGTIYKAILKGGEEFIVRRLRKVVEKREFEEKVQTLISKHPNVIPIRAYYFDSGAGANLLIYNYIKPASLSTLLPDLPRGAAVGAVFGELLNALLEIRGKVTTKFRRTFNCLQSTLSAIKPVIQEMEKQNDDLGLPKEELEFLIKEMEKGTMLVRKCSEIKLINYEAQVRYKGQLMEFIGSLVRFSTINMQAYCSRGQKETLLEVERTLNWENRKETLLEVQRVLNRENKFRLAKEEDTAGSSSDSIPVSQSEMYDSTTTQAADENAVGNNYIVLEINSEFCIVSDKFGV